MNFRKPSNHSHVEVNVFYRSEEIIKYKTEATFTFVNLLGELKKSLF